MGEKYYIAAKEDAEGLIDAFSIIRLEPKDESDPSPERIIFDYARKQEIKKALDVHAGRVFTDTQTRIRERSTNFKIPTWVWAIILVLGRNDILNFLSWFYWHPILTFFFLILCFCGFIFWSMLKSPATVAMLKLIPPIATFIKLL